MVNARPPQGRMQIAQNTWRTEKDLNVLTIHILLIIHIMCIGLDVLFFKLVLIDQFLCKGSRYNLQFSPCCYRN